MAPTAGNDLPMHQLSIVNLSVLPWSHYFGHDQVHTDSQTECFRLLVKHILTVRQHNDAIEVRMSVYTCTVYIHVDVCSIFYCVFVNMNSSELL